jgi:hypothetical protein
MSKLAHLEDFSLWRSPLSRATTEATVNGVPATIIELMGRWRKKSEISSQSPSSSTKLCKVSRGGLLLFVIQYFLICVRLIPDERVRSDETEEGLWHLSTLTLQLLCTKSGSPT